MLEADPLQRVGELDVDAEVVGIELELVTGTDSAVLVDVHRQRRERAVERELPVRVAVGVRVVADRCAAGRSRFRGLRRCGIGHALLLNALYYAGRFPGRTGKPGRSRGDAADPEESRMPSLSTADHRVSPPRIEIPRDYNAAHDLIERNLRAGRAGKLAYIDDAGRVHVRRARRARESMRQRADGARPARRGARAALPARHDRFPGGVPGRDQGRHRSDRGEHAADGPRLRLHAARQPRARADRLGAAPSDDRAGPAATPAAHAT